MPHRFATLLFALVLSVFATAQETPPSVRNFLDLEAYAAKLADQPYKPVQQALDPFFDKLEYDGHRQIQFIQDKALLSLMKPKNPSVSYCVYMVFNTWSLITN